MDYLDESSAQRRMVWKLKKLKNRVKAWEKEQNILKHLMIDTIENDLEYYYMEKSQRKDMNVTDLHIKEL
jgi:hypothetical protein